MSRLLRLFGSRFHHEDATVNVADFKSYDEGNRVGFPTDVVAFDYNSVTGCVVIGTSRGDVILYGSRGATWSVALNGTSCRIDPAAIHICKLLFMAANCIFVLCRGGRIVKLEVKDGLLTRHQEDIAFAFPNNYKWPNFHVQKITEQSYNFLFVPLTGNEVISVNQSTMEDQVVAKTSNFPEWCDPTAEILSVTSYPGDPKKLFVILEGGIMGVFDGLKWVGSLTLHNSDESYVKRIEWDKSGSYAYCFGENNKYTKWKFEVGHGLPVVQEIQGLNPDQSGPYPCNDTKFFSTCTDVKKRNEQSEYIIYQGGQYRGNYEDKALVTIWHEKRSVQFEVQGEIIGMHAVGGGYDGDGKNGIIMICTTNELIGIDLEDEHWRMMQPSHFYSVNNSTPTCQTRAVNIDESVWARLMKTSDDYWREMNYTNRSWPLFFFKNLVEEGNNQRPAYRQVHITGHASGNICFWSSGGLHMKALFVVRTSAEFEIYSPPNIDDHTKRRRQIGSYDPYEDDENLFITNIHLDSKSGTLFVTNRGGFIITYDLCDTSTTYTASHPKPVIWDKPNKCSTNSLEPRTYNLQYNSGYQPRKKEGSDTSQIVQMKPNVDITTICYMEKFSCFGIGSNCGFMFIDMKTLFVAHYTPYHVEIGIHEQNETGEKRAQSRYKTLKKSLRRTFRRKKRADPNTIQNEKSEVKLSIRKTVVRNGPSSTSTLQQGTIKSDEDEEVSFVERQIEARDNLPNAIDGAVVTCMRAIRIPATDEKTVDDVIAVGTSCGAVLFYRIQEYHTDHFVTFQASRANKLTLPQRQPILNVDVSSEDGYYSPSTRIVIVSDEQIRMYGIPPKAKLCRYKLTSLEGLKIKKGSVARLASTKDQTQFETFVILLTNNGDLRIHSIQRPDHFEKMPYIDPTDILAMNSVFLTRDGEITYLKKSSEIQRSSYNTNYRGWSNFHGMKLKK